MLDPTPALALGFILGMGHATDADHVAAVTTIVSRERAVGRAASVGALWGLGHTATIVLVGSAIILFNIAIPPRLGLMMELAVALMLIALGLLTLRRRISTPASPLRPLGVGFIHGLAGSAFVAMLVLQTVPSPLTGILYLMIFGTGTVAGMTLVTAAIAVPSLVAGRRLVALQRHIQVGAGALSIAVGLILAHEAGVEGGLFTADPQWDPR